MIARRIVAPQIEDADLARKAYGGARNERLAMPDAGPIDGMARGEVIAAIKHQVRNRHLLVQGLVIKAADQRFDADAGVQLPQHMLA